jgi:type VI protein secretion system component Hcp
MIRRLSCVLVLASTAAACGTEDPDAADPNVNALEASGRVEFFVRIVGANGQAFRGETVNAQFLGAIPAFRYFSDVNRGATGATHCTSFIFTKLVAEASPQLVNAVATRETLQSVHFDFVKSSGFIFQKLDLAGVRISQVEQAVAPPEDDVASLLLEEATLVPVNTANVTLTVIPQNANGTAGAAIVSPFTCVR